MNGSRTLELQTIAAMAMFSASEIHRYNIAKYLTDPESQAFLVAVEEAGDNAVNISRTMTALGFPVATPDYVMDKLLKLAYAYGEVNIDSNVQLLHDIKVDIDDDLQLDDILVARKSGKIKRSEARNRVLELYKDTSFDDSGMFISTNDWGPKAVAIYEANRLAVESGIMPTWPMQFRRLREKQSFIFPGHIVALIARSGVGKTMLALQWAHWWAEHHGRVVMYCLLEMTAASVIARYVNRVTGLPTRDIELGLHNAKVTDTLKPYDNGGKVIFWECAGKSMQDIIAQAELEKADVILDTFNKLNVGHYSADSKTDRIAEANIDLVSYLQKHKRIGVEVLQLDKANTAANLSSVEYAKDSIDFYQSCRYAFSMQFDIARTNELIDNPIPGRSPVWQYADKPTVYGNLVIDKNSFGGDLGWQDPIFRDGERSQIFENPRGTL